MPRKRTIKRRVGGSETQTKQEIQTKQEKKTKRVRIHSPSNTIQIIEPRSSIRESNPTYEECTGRNYPCMFKGAIIDNRQEIQDYLDMLREKNASTGYKSRIAHKTDIFSKLRKTGKYAKKIPQEFRLYNIETGEIFDMRNFNGNSK